MEFEDIPGTYKFISFHYRFKLFKCRFPERKHATTTDVSCETQINNYIEAQCNCKCQEGKIHLMTTTFNDNKLLHMETT